ncbi:MAG TPA: NAD(P)/FAD-dependent oxidoreductase [Polyangia bacterium]|nr:NAD(P)/FAD-dependent oxidoreductase [Polyangia bacterium]
MTIDPSYEAIVVGAGPNGLAAAIVLARAGRSVLLVEARDTLGGGARSAELTVPGYVHAVCSAIHPLAVVSPFFRSLPLAEHGLTWCHPETPLAHPLDDGTAAALERSLDETASGLGEDGAAYRRLYAPLVARADDLFAEMLGPLPLLPRHPLLLARFGWHAIQSAVGLARRHFETPAARALLAGCAAHSFLPLEQIVSASFGLVLALAGHAIGWPCARGGTQRITDALAACLRGSGGHIRTGWRIGSLAELPPARVVLLDVGPRQLIALAGDRLPAGYRRRLERYRYGPGIFKVDWALDGPVPWSAPAGRRAATLHLGGTLEEIAAAEAAVGRGEHAERPYVLFAQQSVCDPTRAPAGRHTGWAYCHVPTGSTVDMTERIEAQVERFAPGFRERILARNTMNSADYERYNQNNVGGDITGGMNNLGQLFTRPVARWVPYATPDPGIYLCSSSTPPGGGVHGLCGYHAARAVLRRVFGDPTGGAAASP